MFSSDLILIGILLLAAMLVGWWTGRSSRPGRRERVGNIPAEYFKGLNFLLNEQPDKALEVFIRMVEVDSETIETHFALGSLFRRRGEVDRAIRIHQNLIARPNLSRTHRAQALYELGEDYLRAGLLDRAESLFAELSSDRPHEADSLASLLLIFEQQKDWEKAIDAARRLETVTGQLLNREIAQYHCELAERRMQDNDRRTANKLLRRALSFDRVCVRAMLLQAKLAEQAGDERDAVRNYRRALIQDPRRAGEVLPVLARLLRSSNLRDSLVDILEQVVRENPDAAGSVSMAVLRDGSLQDPELERFVERHVGKDPLLSDLQTLSKRIDGLRGSGQPVRLGTIANELFRNAHGDAEHYACSECGYSGKTLYWQCPSCRRWDTLEPQHGITLGGH